MSPTAIATPAEELPNPECEYHIARAIYVIPRICKTCSAEICNKPIAIMKSPGWIQTYGCTKTRKHIESCDNPLIKPAWRLENQED
jgi:hypothetical protein